MALTDHCDIFASLNEEAFNRTLQQIQRQRPSLFNYATAYVADNPKLLCRPINPHPIVPKRKNPLITLEPPLPIPGTNFGVNFSVQISKMAIDFHPPNAITLPPELRPLPEQQFAIFLTLCAGFGCPPKEIVEKYVPPPESEQTKEDSRATNPVVVLPTRELICFCLDIFVLGKLQLHNYAGKEYLDPSVTGVEIVDIKPEGLENSMECYIQLLLKLSVLPKLRLLMEKVTLELMKNVLSVVLKPMPTSPGLPNNPAIEQDQLKVFVKVEVI